MLKLTKYGDLTRIDSARSMFGRGYYWTTAYLVDGLLVDTGCAHSSHELLEKLRGRRLTTLLNTHSHEDHIGANGLLQSQWKGIQVLAHPQALPVLKHPREAQPLQFYRRLFWGWPMPSEGQPVSDGQLIETENHRFQVMYTPGHSRDHICLYEPEHGWLFTGDLFIGGRDRGLRSDSDIWGIIASLKRVRDLPLERLFPGCARVRDNPKQEVTAKIAYLEQTGKKVMELNDQGLNPEAIARSIFGGPMFIELLTMGDFSRVGMVKSYLRQKDQNGGAIQA
jgi:hydroxyacylglutathione hydrolase